MFHFYGHCINISINITTWYLLGQKLTYIVSISLYHCKTSISYYETGLVLFFMIKGGLKNNETPLNDIKVNK